MKYSVLEKRVKKLEEAVEETEDISLIDDKLHNELIDELNAFIRSCNDKFISTVGNFNVDRSLKKTKSFKLIKAIKNAWIDSAKREIKIPIEILWGFTSYSYFYS